MSWGACLVRHQKPYTVESTRPLKLNKLGAQARGFNPRYHWVLNLTEHSPSPSKTPRFISRPELLHSLPFPWTHPFSLPIHEIPPDNSPWNQHQRLRICTHWQRNKKTATNFAISLTGSQKRPLIGTERQLDVTALSPSMYFSKGIVSKGANASATLAFKRHGSESGKLGSTACL